MPLFGGRIRVVKLGAGFYGGVEVEAEAKRGYPFFDTLGNNDYVKNDTLLHRAAVCVSY
jgi:hypothetical protein